MIDKIHSIQGLGSSQPVRGSQRRNPAARKDALELSEQARVQAQAKAILKSHEVQQALAQPLEREQKIEEVKAKLAEGRYRANEKEVLQKIAISLLA